MVERVEEGFGHVRYVSLCCPPMHRSTSLCADSPADFGTLGRCDGYLLGAAAVVTLVQGAVRSREQVGSESAVLFLLLAGALARCFGIRCRSMVRVSSWAHESGRRSARCFGGRCRSDQGGQLGSRGGEVVKKRGVETRRTGEVSRRGGRVRCRDEAGTYGAVRVVEMN